MLSEESSLWALFVSAFVSATLFPGASEVLLGVLLDQKSHDRWELWAIASLGNTLGGMSTWGLGRFMAWWYPIEFLTKPRHQQALTRLQQWGSPALLLSWVPILGDPLCFVAGWIRTHWIIALGYIGGGKAIRYALIVLALT